MDKVGEGVQKVQTSQYKINKSWGCMRTTVNNIVSADLKEAKRLRDYILKVHKKKFCNYI